MISRYNRRAVKHNLQVCGVSHSALDQHPLPEKVDTECTTLQPAASTCNRSLCPSVVAVETSRVLSGIDCCTGTGESTERSSVFSWAYDEFDKAASRQVQLLFEEIDEELYEGRGGVQQDECKLWTSRFPHLRIVGKQLVCPTDEGFQWFSVSTLNSSGTPIQSTVNELCVQGHRAAVCTEVTHNPYCGASQEDLHTVSEEEGLMEEYLAFDWKDLREAVIDFLFDDVWQQLIGCMEELLIKLWEGCSSDEEKSSASLSPPHHQSHNNPSGLKSSTSTTLPQLDPQTQDTLSSKSRGSKSRLKFKKQRKPSTPSGVCSGSAVQHHSLKELIVVHSLPLQQRHTTTPEHTIHESDEISVSKPRPRGSLEKTSSFLPRPPPWRRPLPPRTLLPLAQCSTAGNIEDIIRGTRLAPSGDRLSSSAMTLSRNTLLPPIATGDKERTHCGHHTHLSQRYRVPSNCAQSTVSDEAGSLLSFSRPSTTHTFRSDTPHCQSFTVLDCSGPSRTGRVPETKSLGIGVTGIRLGTSSTSFNSFTTHTLDHSPIEDGVGPEDRAPPPALLGPLSLQSLGRGGLMTRSNRPGP